MNPPSKPIPPKPPMPEKLTSPPPVPKKDRKHEPGVIIQPSGSTQPDVRLT